MVEMRKSVKNFSESMKELEALVHGGRLHHDCNPILSWMISNVRCKVDANQNIFPRKPDGQDYSKIDGAVALIMALGRYITRTDEPVAYVTGQGLRSL